MIVDFHLLPGERLGRVRCGVAWTGAWAGKWRFGHPALHHLQLPAMKHENLRRLRLSGSLLPRIQHFCVDHISTPSPAHLGSVYIISIPRFGMPYVLHPPFEYRPAVLNGLTSQRMIMMEGGERLVVVAVPRRMRRLLFQSCSCAVSQSRASNKLLIYLVSRLEAWPLTLTSPSIFVDPFFSS